jgi:hypothetical protein
MRRDMSWLAPLAGLAFLVVAIVAIAISGEPPDATEDSAREIVDFYVDNRDSQTVSAFMAALGGALLVFFGGALRRVLRAAEGPDGTLSAIAFAGLIVLALGLAIDGTITLTLAETADDIDPSAVQALSALYANDYIPFVMGSLIFLLATGLSVLRHGALPKWIGWIAIVLAVLAVTPLGFASLIGAVLLIAVISVLLTMRARSAGPDTRAAA